MRRKLTALLFATALLVPAACGGNGDGGDNGNGDGDGPDVVQIGLIPIVDVAPVFLGIREGFFEQQGIELETDMAAGGADIVPGVQSGTYTFGFSNVISMMLAHAASGDIKVVSNGNNSTGVDGEDFGSLMVGPDSDVQSVTDLAGATIAANTLNNIVDTIVRASMRNAGGDPTSMEFVAVPFPDMPDELIAGNVDAVFAVEPAQTAIRAQGGRSVAYSWVDAYPGMTVAVYFTSTELIETDPDLVARFTTAMQESLAYANDNPDEARAIIPEYTSLTPELASEITLPTWPPDIDRASVEALAELALGDGVLSEPPDLDTLLP